MNDREIHRVVVVGGGSAGWLAASIIASKFRKSEIEVVLIESTSIGTLGVGEGTWPSMKSTLRDIGIDEKEFICACSASFKQGSKFVNWTGRLNDTYYHPFQLPAYLSVSDFQSGVIPSTARKNFAEWVCPTVLLDKTHRAPKFLSSEDYSSVVNYGYHLDANKFGVLLRDHGICRLGITCINATVTGVKEDIAGNISALSTMEKGCIEGDLFIDCSGFARVLIGKHYGIDYVDKSSILFNDSALAVQVPYFEDDSHVESYTISTAQKYGWIWDIGLSSRRGVGYTFSSSHLDEGGATQALEDYVRHITNKDIESLDVKKINFKPGFLKKSWHKNCVAVGVSAGFLEPLEASALVMIELASNMIAKNMPKTFSSMELLARKYNERFMHHWEHIIEFLKLHYVLSARDDSSYWIEQRGLLTCPDALLEKLEYWKHFPPSEYDEVSTQELFPTASYQYVLHGMGCYSDGVIKAKKEISGGIKRYEERTQSTRNLMQNLPNNRELLNALMNSFN